MKESQKKIVSVAAVCAGLVFAAAAINRENAKNLSGGDTKKDDPHITAVDTENGSTNGATETEGSAAEDSVYQKAPADLVFWYEDASYAPFLEEAAKRYFEQTGVKVLAEYQNTIDFMGDIYDKTMQDEGFPDIYLISGDNLEEAYLYGLAAVNENGAGSGQIAANAVAASTYREKMIGYPLSFNTSLFVYQTGYFETAPESLQAIIDYSDQNEPAENVEYLLEWDVNDAFYDFPFISNSVTFEKTEQESMNAVYNEELYNQDLTFFEEILESFSVDAASVSEESIIENFLAGRTLCAMIDSDSLHYLEGYTYSLMEIPNLNETLEAKACATTDMLIVNDFSRKNQAAAEFAEFATVEMADRLYGLSGHFSVIQPEEPEWTEVVAYQSYEAAVLVPNSQDAKDFWVNLKETISKYF